MKLFLSGESTIKDLNREFQKQFPFLQLEFFNKSHKPGEQSILQQKIADRTPLKNISTLVPAFITIEAFHTVTEVEQRFQNKYGLPVQVLRKAGDLWVETAQTDTLTLEKQNCIGAASVRKESFNFHTLFL